MTKLEEKNKLREYKADGIQEYDNPMPSWWLKLFYLTIIFAFFYMMYMHVFGGKSLEQELLEAQNELAILSKEKKSAPSNTLEEKTPSLSEKFKDPKIIADGKEVFKTNCVPCHGEHGQGIIGPNLTDEYWLHGGSHEDIIKTITSGVPEKGMISWEPILGKEKIESVAAYIVSIEGSKPPNPKAPQGEIFKK